MALDLLFGLHIEKIEYDNLVCQNVSITKENSIKTLP